MVSRHILAEVAVDFLKAVAEATKAQLGGIPERTQRSIWMVHTGPDTMSGNDLYALF